VPRHLIVIGGGYSGLELAQAFRRFGSDVTIVESGPQLLAREDIDVSQEMRRILGAEDIQVLVGAELLKVQGRSGDKVTLSVRSPSGGQLVLAAWLRGKCERAHCAQKFQLIPRREYQRGSDVARRPDL
jgi:pyruvate/2-oxoglutarate dehydrogenase complex dihydrolipoamide dehydrogenase (E3) component